MTQIVKILADTLAAHDTADFSVSGRSMHHKVQKFSSGTGSPGWSWKKGRETVVMVVVVVAEVCALLSAVWLKTYVA